MLSRGWCSWQAPPGQQKASQQKAKNWTASQSSSQKTNEWKEASQTPSSKTTQKWQETHQTPPSSANEWNETSQNAPSKTWPKWSEALEVAQKTQEWQSQTQESWACAQTLKVAKTSDKTSEIAQETSSNQWWKAALQTGADQLPKQGKASCQNLHQCSN